MNQWKVTASGGSSDMGAAILRNAQLERTLPLNRHAAVRAAEATEVAPALPEPFTNLDEEDLEIIARYGTMRTYAKNAVLINEGEQSDSFYIILSGRVKAYASDENGKEVTLSMQGAGEYFGELAIIDASPRSASVLTVERSKLTVVSRAAFFRCFDENPQIAVKLIRPLAERIRSLTGRVKNLALLDVYGRVARTLLELASREDGEVLVIDQRPTHQEIANMVGASREMVSRIMKDLSTGGYIQVRAKAIHIPRKLPASW